MNEDISVNLSAEEKILNCFWDLYKERGIHKITVTKICNMAHVNRSTFYAHFIDIYDVLDKIEEKVIIPLEFKKVVFDKLIRAEGNNIFLDKIMLFFDKNIEYLTVLLGKHGDPEFRFKLINKLTSSLIPSMNIKNEDKSRMELLFEYQNAAVISVIMKWYDQNNNISKEDLLKLLIDVTSNGIQKEMNKYMNG